MNTTHSITIFRSEQNKWKNRLKNKYLPLWDNVTGKNKDDEKPITVTPNESEKMTGLLKKTGSKLLTVSTVFPFTLFPNTIDVELGRIKLTFRQFLFSQTHSLDIKDISQVNVEHGIFFSTLEIVTRSFVQNDVRINYLWRKQAELLRDIIDAMRILAEQKVDLYSIETSELMQKLVLSQSQELNTNSNNPFESIMASIR